MNMNTTIVGLLAAIFAAIQSIVQQGNSIEDWKTWALPAALAALVFSLKTKNQRYEIRLSSSRLVHAACLGRYCDLRGDLLVMRY